MAQLVEHHLAKVRVAGSNPVVRSKSKMDLYVLVDLHVLVGNPVSNMAHFIEVNFNLQNDLFRLAYE